MGGRLGFKPERLCSSPFREKLAAHKTQLLALLRTKGVTWIEVYSERIDQTLFFCDDDATRDTLIEAGASEWSIYTKDELRVLVAQNRIAPLSDADLRKLREIKTSFNGTVTS